MKKLTKIMLSFAAALTMTAAIAVTAMAEDVVETITGTYDNTDGTVTMNGVVGSGTSQTLLVLDSNEDIAYINQIDNITSDDQNFSTFKLASGLEPSQAGASVTFKIKIGGNKENNTVQYGTLTITAAAPAVVTIVIGDVINDDGKANVSDITAIRRYIANRNKPGEGTGHTGEKLTKSDNSGQITVGDVINDDNKANVSDITAIRRYIANRNKPGTGTGHTGEQVEVLKDTSAE